MYHKSPPTIVHFSNFDGIMKQELAEELNKRGSLAYLFRMMGALDGEFWHT